MTLIKRISLSALLLSAAPVYAGDLEQALLRCSVLGDVSARLGCFDAIAKDAATPVADVAPPGTPVLATSAKTSPTAAPQTAVEKTVELANKPPETPISRMEQDWELVPSARRGRYNFRPYRDSYLLIANFSTTTNDQPFADVQPTGLKSKRIELAYQLSFKTKLLEGIGDTPIDLWAAYTQQSFWQAYNRADSSPFRDTNYMPEMMLVVPINKSAGPATLRYASLGAVHASNGQSGALSRSWNRMYAEFGGDAGKFGATMRVWKRLDNAKSDNDNIDITDFMGHGDLRVTYNNAGNEFSAMVRRNFSTSKGAVQVGWAFPVATNLKGYIHAFGGYGQSLIDYNYSRKSIGVGVLMDL
ncbi:phospholipase A [Massilia sp. S19_KUP03_FR1]|uniref:phospholipase A n=1 Tax=Massilia sp. S19_KUP03_FR1 TaxID=3025503 RepID=UPI002FCDC5A5